MQNRRTSSDLANTQNSNNRPRTENGGPMNSTMGNQPRIQTARSDPVRKYYGVETAERVADSISSNKVFILMNTLLILTGAIITITLNITNLNNAQNQQTMLKMIQDEVDLKLSVFDNLEQLVKGDLKPKVTLINSAVSVSIPSQISNLQNKLTQRISNLEDMVGRKCNFNPLATIFPTVEPSKPPTTEEDEDTSDDDKVDISIRPIDYKSPMNCSKPNDHPTMEPGPNFYAVPNLGPSSSNADECYTNPSFSIGSSIYMFSQEIRKTDCIAGELQSVQIILGRIVDKGQQGPQASPLLVWSVPNPRTINSCAVAAGDEMGWVLCSVTLTAASGGPSPHTFDGFWLYRLTPDTDVVSYRISGFAYLLDKVYDSVYIGKGGGVQKGSDLYFQMYGISRNRASFTALCDHGSCPGVGGGGYQTLCDKSMTVLGSDESLVTSAYLRVGDIYSGKPVIVSQTFPPSDSYRGSNGRIYLIGDSYGIYLAPSSWNRYLRFGVTPDISVKSTRWLDAKYPVMYIRSTCTNKVSNMCPEICSTRGYQDIFPLSADSESYTYIGISPKGEGTSSFVAVRDRDGHHASKEILSSYFSILSSTISCFTYKEEIWCIAVSEGKRTKGSAQRIFAHSYRVIRGCGHNLVYPNMTDIVSSFSK
ncbi:attachment glycoprotein [Wenzhou Apodemus agrarius henipavirus 1]|uniref:Attachment glycoprotein n=1 Tax=Wenzhou Apodemus agrarius henipavirus 1 TaxID=2877509 RepID=A0AAE8XRT6_9MONO|nr:attachment glycoprotein [Wenzhou Apodemus agrarius henipavirus 1]